MSDDEEELARFVVELLRDDVFDELLKEYGLFGWWLLLLGSSEMGEWYVVPSSEVKGAAGPKPPETVRLE